MRRARAWPFLLLLALPACNTPVDALAARAHFNSIAPEYRSYVTKDPELDADQKARRERNVQAWQLWVEALEAKK